jgi:mono/diheme cytochrome c family protein
MMNRVLRWVGIVLGSCVALGMLTYAVVYVLSERTLRHAYTVPAFSIAIPTDPASVVEGRRLATIRGCFGGCHGRQAEGMVMFDQPLIARIVAPNLTAAVRKYSDADLAIIIRDGVRPGGRSTMVMPSEALHELTDADLARIIAFLKSLPAASGPGPSVSLGPLGRIGVVTGKFKPTAQLIAETVPPPDARGEEPAFGRYLARTICAQCHGTSLRGDTTPDFTSPSLVIVGAYSLKSFAQLLRTGVALGGRNLATMSPWARSNLRYFTDEEIAALYSYLHAMDAVADGSRDQ